MSLTWLKPMHNMQGFLQKDAKEESVFLPFLEFLEVA
jgi:hypothetical protein